MENKEIIYGSLCIVIRPGCYNYMLSLSEIGVYTEIIRVNVRHSR